MCLRSCCERAQETKVRLFFSSLLFVSHTIGLCGVTRATRVLSHAFICFHVAQWTLFLFFLLSLALLLFYLMLSFVVVFLTKQSHKFFFGSLLHSFSYLAPLFVITLLMSLMLLCCLATFICLSHAREKKHRELFMLLMELVWWLEHTRLHSLQHMVSIRMVVIHHPLLNCLIHSWNF